ncbi:MAG: nucleoside monophosphate kinase, partial [Oscillospiraceae bacterium]|nr:nucleoside monophosphate kinase [Oscillospiraceae bacterium]
GKGTQADILSGYMGIPHISTGNILRDAIHQGTPVGDAVKKYIAEGCLVPDEVMIGIIESRLHEPDCRYGFILDGFPRTYAQAAALDDIGVHADAVLSLEAPDEDIERRLAGRRSCKQCGCTFHLTKRPPLVPNMCDACGGELFLRDDDNYETVHARLVVYHENTAPLIEYYKARGILHAIPARDDIWDITVRCQEALGLHAS